MCLGRENQMSETPKHFLLPGGPVRTCQVHVDRVRAFGAARYLQDPRGQMDVLHRAREPRDDVANAADGDVVIGKQGAPDVFCVRTAQFARIG